MLTLHLRINDASTGRPTAARVCVTGPDLATFAPLGRAADFPTGRGECVGGHFKQPGGLRWTYTDGSCEITLPAGVPLRFRITKGPQFRPLDETVTLGPGQMSLRFALSRWCDLSADGWVSGDSRCHFLTPHAALLEAAAEDLDVVNVLAAETQVLAQDGETYWPAPELLAFSGQTAALEKGGRAVAVNTLNAHPVLGKVGLLHSHRPVFPLAFGGPDVTDDWSLADWCGQCHRKGGLTVWVDAFRESGGLVGGEALACAILGHIDTIEYDGRPRPSPFLPWVYRLWNAGFLVPLVGGSGKDSNAVPLGGVRTFALASGGRMPPVEGIDATIATETKQGANAPRSPVVDWIEAVRAGRSFVTTGPLLSSLHPPRFSARSITPFDRLELVADGAVVHSASPSEVDGIWSAELERPVAGTQWVAARVVGKDAFAHTSPLRLGPPTPSESDVKPLRLALEKTREWVESHGRFANPKRKEQHLVRLTQAVAKLGAAP